MSVLGQMEYLINLPREEDLGEQTLADSPKCMIESLAELFGRAIVTPLTPQFAAHRFLRNNSGSYPVSEGASETAANPWAKRNPNLHLTRQRWGF